MTMAMDASSKINNKIYISDDIEYEIKEGQGTMAYSTETPINTFVDICLNKSYINHANSEVGLKTVKVLDAVYRSIKSERVEKV